MLILIAHGSRRPEWRASVEGLVKLLQTDIGRDAVQLAYMDCTPPALMDVVSEAVRQGVKRIRVLPLFLTAEGHVDRDIQPLVEEARESYAAVVLELLPPVGKHPMFLELLKTIAIREP